MSCFYCTKSHNKIVIGKKTQVTLAKCSKNIHYVTKYGKTPTLHPCYWWTCYPKPMGIILLRERCCSTLLVSGCSSDVGTWLQEPWWSPTLMLGDTAWLTVIVPVHPKGVGWGWSQDMCRPDHNKNKGRHLGWNRKGFSLNCFCKVWSTLFSKILLYAVALRFPFIGTKGPNN